MTDTVNHPTAHLIASLAIAGAEIKSKDNAHHLLAPKDYTLHNISEAIEKQNPAPARKKGTAVLQSLDSLIAYCNDQGQDAAADKTAASAHATSYIYADSNNHIFTAVFNDQRGEHTGWRDHRATYQAKQTPECIRWLTHSGKKFTQTEFAEFIEDNITDVVNGEILLAVATTIAATTGINFISSRRLQDGQTQITYNEVIDAKAGQDGALTIPKTFALGLRVFANDTQGYALEARLKYRLTGSGGITLHYELVRMERVIEDAIKGYIERLEQETGYIVLLGQP